MFINLMHFCLTTFVWWLKVSRLSRETPKYFGLTSMGIGSEYIIKSVIAD